MTAAVPTKWKILVFIPMQTISPLTMAYVPFQQFHTTFELHKALQVGTVFPELCKPFCGKRGVRR